jgi:hypothetical protein
MNRKMRVSRCFLVMGILFLGLTLGMTCKKKNQPPGVPAIPSGPTSGRKGDTLRFSTVAEDPDGDSVAVRFDWSDSTVSDWSKLVPSGDSVVMTHAWQKLGTYSVRAQARDVRGTASAWSSEHQLTTVASFSVTFGGDDCDEGNSVQQTSDGGYIVAGWTKSYGAGGWDVWLIKTDASGNKVWDRTFGGTGDDGGNSVEQTSDGGYIIVGCTGSYGAGASDIWLVKTDASGNEVWDKTFGDSLDDFGFSVRQATDGGYIIAGCADAQTRGWLIKTDAMGNKTWDLTLPAMLIGGSVQQTSDGGYVITGAGSGNAQLVKTDSSGSVVWERSFGGADDDWGNSVRQTFDGGYIITGGTMSSGAGGEDVWLIKTDASGDKVWDRTFGSTGDDAGNSVQQTSDGGYIVTGYSWSYGVGGQDVWLIKTDADGN